MKTSRITRKDLERAVKALNEQTGHAVDAWRRVGDRNIANVGTYVVDGAYGGWKVCQIVSESGGEKEITSGYRPARETLAQLRAFSDGIAVGRA